MAALAGRIVRVAGLAAGLAIPCGCASLSETIARRATPVTVGETLDALGDPANRAKVRGLLGEAAIREASRELAEGLVQGALAGLDDDARAARIAEISERFVRRLSEAASTSIRDDLTPTVEHLLRASVRAAVESALAPEHRDRLAGAAAGITRQAVTTLVEVTSSGIRDDLGPAVAASITDQIAPALEEALARRLVPALVRALEAEARPVVLGLAREGAKQVVLGVDDGFVALGFVDPEHGGRSSMWSAFNDGLDRGLRLGELLAWVLGALALILALWLLRTSRRMRALEERSRRSEGALAGLVRDLRVAPADKPWMAEVRAMAEEALRKAEEPPPGG